MTKILLSLLVLSLASALAVAQDTPGSAVPQTSTPSQSTSQSTSATPNDQSGSTMRGCLGGISGNYTLTDDRTGTVYNLTGSIDNLGSKVGQHVGNPACLCIAFWQVGCGAPARHELLAARARLPLALEWGRAGD